MEYVLGLKIECVNELLKQTSILNLNSKVHKIIIMYFVCYHRVTYAVAKPHSQYIFNCG